MRWTSRVPIVSSIKAATMPPCARPGAPSKAAPRVTRQPLRRPHATAGPPPHRVGPPRDDAVGKRRAPCTRIALGTGASKMLTPLSRRRACGPAPLRPTRPGVSALGRSRSASRRRPGGPPPRSRGAGARRRRATGRSEVWGTDPSIAIMLSAVFMAGLGRQPSSGRDPALRGPAPSGRQSNRGTSSSVRSLRGG